eukprot:6212645-Pleurochrysis_carterae.AAC.1
MQSLFLKGFEIRLFVCQQSLSPGTTRTNAAPENSCEIARNGGKSQSRTRKCKEGAKLKKRGGRRGHNKDHRHALQL